ncbi:YVTN family beta-propeller repeat protein [Mycolicibacterium fortuitum]
MLAAAGCSGSQTETAGQSPPESAAATGSVWVADETGNSLTVLDTATNTVATTLTGIQGPHNVQISRDAARAYATSAGTDTVVAIDTGTYEVTATAQTGPHPAHVIEAPNGKVYVANSGDGTVSVFQSQGLQPLGRIEVGGMPHGLRAAADGSRIVVANHSTGALDVIDAQTDRLQFSVPVGNEPAQVAVSADGRYAYTGITQPATVVKVDLNSRKVVGTTAVSAPPVQVYLTPDDAMVISADQGTPEAPGHAASLIDTATMAVRATVPTGAGPHGVVIDPSGRLAWVTDSYDNSVSIIDLAGQSVSATIPVGEGPNGISYSPRPPSTSAPTVALKLPAPATAPGGQPPSHHSDGHHPAPPPADHTESPHKPG